MQNIAITGASSGLGKALALLFAKEGARLFLNARTKQNLEKLQTQIQNLGASARIFAFDVSDEKACKAWCDELFKQEIDILILNAGMACDDDISEQRQIQVTKTNVLGISNIIFYAITAMKKQELKQGFKGQIVLISSVASLLTLPNAPCYSASKHFVSALSKALSLAEPEICFTLIRPGFIHTKLTQHIKLKMMPLSKASEKIHKAIKARKNLSFPWHIVFFARIFSYFPPFLQRLFVPYLNKRARL